MRHIILGYFMKMKNMTLLAVAVTSLISTGALAFDKAKAGDAGLPNYYIGPEIGLAFSGTNLNLGVTGGWKYSPDIVLGAFYNYINQGSTSSTNGGTAISANASVNLFGVEAGYLLGGNLQGAQIGAKIGASVASASATVGTVSTSNSATSLILGPKVAYDYQIGGNFTAGGEVNLLFTTASGGSTLTDVLGVLKYWF